ncbi:MAG: NADH-quinone oxidoreductase subunit K [Gammaproteobacteria bacterium]|nr:NADH-quinone oxidoreductase subunit K [Gammaproteobacteria bacterium]
MSQEILYALAGVGLFVLGLHGLIVYAHLLRKILALNIMGSGVFLVLIALGRRSAVADPVPDAMVITGIVVTVSATALALVLLLRLKEMTGHTDLEQNDRHHEQ